nr:hypothetical protein HAGR004_19570 [Bdellovibrio sp. HAGR004]
MPRGIRYSAEQMDQILKECEKSKQSEVARKFGVSEVTISKWRKKFKGMPSQDIKRVKQLEDENARLKKMIANMAIDIDALKEINAKKW